MAKNADLLTTKVCSKCREEKPLEAFTKDKSKKDGRRSQCRECHDRAYRERYYADHEKTKAAKRERESKRKQTDPEHFNALDRRSRRRYNRKLWNNAINHLGGCCELCGYEDRRALHVDHIDGGGTQERREKHSEAIYRAIVAMNLPGYRVLCANCNFREHHKSITPSPAKDATYFREYRQKLRNEALDFKGGECVHCGETDREILCFDHVHSDGCRDRRRGVVGHRVFTDVIANPAKYQILCHNCNWIKRHEHNETGRQYA